MAASAFEQSVAQKFRLGRAPTLTARRDAPAPIAISRLQADGCFRGTTMEVRPDEAFTFQVAMMPMETGDIWINGRRGPLGAAAGDTFVFDLTSNPIANLKPPFDYVRFYLPTCTLEHLAYERGLKRVGGLRASTVGTQDMVMQGLAMAVMPALRSPSTSSALFLDSIALAFHAHAVRAYSGSPDEGVSRAGLTPRQLKQALDYMEAQLGGDPTIADLAKTCGLSSSHFARAFTQSMGMPPHRWLMNRRVERAKELLLAGDLEIAHIALVCGFTDQSHLNKVFARFEGYGPGRWRRMRRH
jgi:AraC-like DNA-binding protein